MRRWTWAGVLLVIVWGGAFAITFFVTEWRNPDLGRLRADVEALGGRIIVPAATAAPTPELHRAPLTPGAEVPLGLARVTVVGISTELDPPFKPGEAQVEFILKGPHQGGLAFEFKVLDEDGFLCDSGINAEVGTPLGPGEKTRVWVYYQCAEGATPATLTLNGVTFEFPQL